MFCVQLSCSSKRPNKHTGIVTGTGRVVTLVIKCVLSLKCSRICSPASSTYSTGLIVLNNAKVTPSALISQREKRTGQELAKVGVR